MGTGEQHVTCAECGEETELWVERGEKPKCLKCAGLIGDRTKVIEGSSESELPEREESVSGKSVEE